MNPKWDTFSWAALRTLLEAVNHLIIERAPASIRARRAGYVKALPRDPDDFVIDWTAYDRPRLLIVGDPGEADASQYAVIDPLLAVHRGEVAWDTKQREKSDFMVVLSDVIYPSGDVNDYLNGFYVPFREYDRPIYALPGNHDWYDGLSGFMYHFCGARRLFAKPIAGARLADRITARLWRRAAKPNRALDGPIAERDLHNARRRDAEEPVGPVPRGVQPASYFALDLAGVRLIAIDTGVTGELDAGQGEWLLRMSTGEMPKVLLTGKPLLTGDRYRPGRIDGSDKTVDDVVRDPAHRYVAAIGGDTHNYQRLPVQIDDRTIQYIVAGGGGAHLSPTHVIPTLGQSAEQAAREPQHTVAERDFRCYPLRGDSLALFCRRLGPLLFKLLVSTLLVAVGAVLLVLDLRPLDGAVVAAAIASTVLAVVVALVVAYRLRGRLPAIVLDLLPLPPLIALPPLLWGDALVYVAVAAAAVVLALAVTGRRTRGPRQAALYRALTAFVWLAFAGVVVERWLAEVIVAVLALLALVGVVPRLGPGRRRTQPRHDTLGPAAGSAVALAAVGLALAGLEWLAGRNAAAGAAAGVALTAGAIAAAVALYLLLWLRMADPRTLRRMRTGRIGPQRAAEYVAAAMGTGEAPTRPSPSERWVPGEQRTAAVVSRLVRRGSAVADTNAPPFYKSFLEVEVHPGRLVVSCYGVTGYHDARRSPSLEDRVSIPLPVVGTVNDVQLDCTPVSV